MDKTRTFDVLFTLSLLCLWAGMSTDALGTLLDVGFLNWMKYLTKISPILVLAAALVISRTPTFNLKSLRPTVKYWLIVTASWVGFGVLNGIDRGTRRFYVTEDIIPFVIFFAGIIIGSRKNLWSLIERRMLLFLAAGLPIVILSLALIRTAVRSDATESPAYMASFLGQPFLFFLLTLDKPSTWKRKALIMAGFAVYVMAQIIFQKRAPIAMCSSFMVFMLTILVFAGPTWQFSTRLFMRYGFSVASIIILLALTLFFPAPINQSFAKLQSRLANSAQDTSRLEEAVLGWGRMSNSEIIIGKGIGGYFEPGLGIIDTSVDDPEEGRVNRQSSAHTGVFWMVMKGGVILLLLMFGGYLFLILTTFNLSITTTDFACWFYVLAHMAFQCIELLWYHTTSPHVLMVGLCAGRLASNMVQVPEEAS